MVNRGPNKNMVLKNKRGIFFTTFVILVLTLFFITYTFYTSANDRKTIHDRIVTMNSFVFSLEKDMSRQLFISSYRALLSIESEITETGLYMPNVKESIKEALNNGTVNSKIANLMDGYLLTDWHLRVSNLGSTLNLQVNYTIENITITQNSPWELNINMAINLSIKDKNNLASWEKLEDIQTKINIEGLEDPLYLLNTNGLVTNKIKKTPFIIFAQGNNISNLNSHLENSYYISSQSAPSFLDRLEGKTNSNENGIESLVNLNKLAEQNIQLKDKSVVDYIYFSAQNPTSYKIQGMPQWFKIDDSHLETYQLSNLTV